MRIGFGTDIHKLVEGRPLIVGGVVIPHHLGCSGHSDGDPLIHAICDALLGAIALRDIGFHFPDNDPSNKNMDSSFFLREVMKMVRENGYQVGNIDTVVNLQKPKLSPHIPFIIDNLSKIMEISPNQINVKAKTAEQLGFVGEEKGISTEAIVLLVKSDGEN
ncbi:MAG: 2-C-methyl-D-erythritol 2,4-cyclodiphosphate synthase [Bacteroidales bacterium]|nr:2-C-methyl-D-erythritol 2,4-cyclodiphosphate synthase [Bacteroidales bacterium]